MWINKPKNKRFSNLTFFSSNFQGAEKQYYVSKKCATENFCNSQIHGNMPLCHYLWYEDWKCAECCQGDRCNYYVTVSLLHTVWSEGFLYKVAPPELKISPIMYFVIHNSIVISKILKIVVQFWLDPVCLCQLLSK